MKGKALAIKLMLFLVSLKKHKKISTHLLTVLTISVILHIEQKRGERFKEEN